MRHILGLVAITTVVACGGQIVDPIPDPPRPGPLQPVENPIPPPRAYPGQPAPVPPVPPPYATPYPTYPQEPPPAPIPYTPAPPGYPFEPAASYVPGVAVGSACLRMPVGLSVAPELHVIGVYEALVERDFQEHKKGPIDVDVKAGTSPVTLFLSSYEAVGWHVHLQPGAKVSRVYLSSFYPDETSVDGIPDDAEVFVLPQFGAGCAYGWTPETSNGGCEFTKTIGQVRATTGAVESSFQGSYTGTRFTVPYGAPSAPDHSGYDMTAPCVDRCATSGGALAWESTFPGSDVAIDGVTAKATNSTWGTQLRSSRGATCGKHYFEVEVSGVGATVGARYKQASDYYPLDYPWSAASTSLTNGRVGVALDLDEGTIEFVTSGGRSGPSSLGLWSWGEVVAGVDLDPGAGAATLIAEPPFKYAPPEGYRAGF